MHFMNDPLILSMNGTHQTWQSQPHTSQIHEELYLQTHSATIRSKPEKMLFHAAARKVGPFLHAITTQ